MNKTKSFTFETFSKSVRDFNLFINENIRKVRKNSILSFAFPVPSTNLIEKLNSFDKRFNDFLFYEKPDDDISFIAVDQLFDLKGAGKGFQSFASSLFELKANLISNWDEYSSYNFPFITGGVKFDSNKSSEEWNDFNPMHFFIPRAVIFQNKGKTFLLYNFQPGIIPDVQKVKNNFEEFSSSLMNSNNSPIRNEKSFIIQNANEIENLQNWKKMFTVVMDNLKQDCKKVVLSRRTSFNVKDEIDWKKSFKSVANEFPNCYLFLIKSNGSRFFGASPEKFISASGNRIEIDALAATASEKHKNFVSELMTEKNIKEHNFVIDFIKNVLSNYTDKFEIDRQPRIKKFKDVNHLHSRIIAEIKSKEKLPELIDSLFPTPAVCGQPKQSAMELINKLENFDRGLFSGLIGWMDPDLNCEFAVAIRSALYKNKKLFVYAGAGIVEESVLEEEYAETEFKLRTILNLFNEKNQS